MSPNFTVACRLTETHMPSPATSSRTLIVDSRGPSGAHRARSRREALQCMNANEYDSILLHTETPGRDEYGLISYLAATWPSFLQHLTIRTVTRGARSYQWNHDAACFDLLATPPGRRREFSRHSQPSVALTVATR